MFLKQPITWSTSSMWWFSLWEWM